jgi:hypothetical protein
MIAQRACPHPFRARVMYTATRKALRPNYGPEFVRYFNGKTGCADCGRIWGIVGTRKQSALEWRRLITHPCLQSQSVCR